MLDAGQLEGVRMLTNHDMDSASPFACLLIGQPTLRRRLKLGQLAEALQVAKVQAVRVPRDCTDGFAGAHWARPETYLDASARLAMSVFAALPDQVVSKGIARLRADLQNGAWQKTGDAARTQYVNLTVGRAKQLIPHIVAEVMKPFTSAAVANAAAKNEKEGVASKRVDIEGGAGATSKVRQLTKKDVSGMTDEQILDM
jgi:hypothetical protein